MRFADANSDYKNADFVIFGVPYDLSSSYRAGSRFAPTAIRAASYNFESFVFEKSVSMDELKIHDMGDIGEWGIAGDMIKDVEFTVKKIITEEKFSLALGGEHTLTVGAARALKDLKVGIIFFDAHLDFRTEYLGDALSHACVSRRTYEILGEGMVGSIGVRSMSKGEKEDAEKLGYIYGDFDRVVENISADKIYISVDVDVIDPSYAPGVGNPEPLGMTPRELLEYIDTLFRKFDVVGVDIVEISPPYDPSGITSVLGAKIAQRIIAVKSLCL